MTINQIMFRINNCLEEQRKQGKKDCRKDILAVKAGVDIEMIDELISKGLLLEETKNGEVRITNNKPKKSGVTDRENLIRKLACKIEETPRRSYQTSKLEGRNGEFLR